jgi:hypothetical protein
VQKNRCPFFFLDGLLLVSLLALSLSDPAPCSSSSSPILTSCDSSDLVERLELDLLRPPSGFGEASMLCDGVKGEEGSGFWPASPLKLSRVGVFAVGSSVRLSAGALCEAKNLPGVGVVGVVSPGRGAGPSGTARVVVFTAWKADIVGKAEYFPISCS